MARNGLLINAGDETIHENEIVLTDKKDLRKNWWYYHKWHVIIAVAAVALIISFIYPIVTQVHPDYNVAFLSSYTWPEDVMSEFQEHLEQYGDDINGDGQVVVQINTYTLGDPEKSTTDPNMFQASVVKFTADASDVSSVIYIHDKDSFNYIKRSGIDGFFLNSNGTDTADSDEDIMISWQDVKGLANLEFSSEAGGEAQDDYKRLLSEMRVSVRALPERFQEKEDKQESYKAGMEFYNRIAEDKKVNEKTEQSGE